MIFFFYAVIGNLIAQVQNPLMGLPAPSGQESSTWWKVAMWALGLGLPALLSGIAGVYTLRAKRLESSVQANLEARKKEIELESERIAQGTQLDIKRLQLQAEQQEKTFERLNTAFDMSLKDSEKLRAELTASRKEMIDVQEMMASKDRANAELVAKYEALKLRVADLERQLKEANA